MILGEFNSKGELIFEIALIAVDGDSIPIQAILDTGFTGWWAINNQDAESLGWKTEQKDMQTAWGETQFNLYEGTVLLDGEEFTIEALGGDELEDNHIFFWVRSRRL